MRKLLPVLLCLGLVGCGTAGRFNSISLGMSRDEVIREEGTPASISAKGNIEYLNYIYYATHDDVMFGRATNYSICFKDGKVISYGLRGDFGTTQLPTQVIQVSGDMKSDEKVSILSGEELEVKIKALNKLLSDGLITQKEFDERKQKLLDEYTSK